MGVTKKLCVLALLLATRVAHAGGSTPVTNVTQLLFYEGHHGILVQVGSMIDPDACGRVDWFILPDTYFRFKEAYGTLLAAKLANKRVTVHVSGCLQGLPKIQHIGVVHD